MKKVIFIFTLAIVVVFSLVAISVAEEEPVKISEEALAEMSEIEELIKTLEESNRDIELLLEYTRENFKEFKEGQELSSEK